MDNFVTREELAAHIEAVQIKCSAESVQIASAAVIAGIETHTKGCEHGKLLHNHLSKLAGIIMGVSACSALIGALISIISVHVFGS